MRGFLIGALTGASAMAWIAGLHEVAIFGLIAAFLIAAFTDDEIVPAFPPGSAADCEREMRRLTDGERGCANPAEHRR